MLLTNQNGIRQDGVRTLLRSASRTPALFPFFRQAAHTGGLFLVRLEGIELAGVDEFTGAGMELDLFQGMVQEGGQVALGRVDCQQAATTDPMPTLRVKEGERIRAVVV
jgi:hypothetical protein